MFKKPIFRVSNNCHFFYRECYRSAILTHQLSSLEEVRHRTIFFLYTATFFWIRWTWGFVPIRTLKRTAYDAHFLWNFYRPERACFCSLRISYPVNLFIIRLLDTAFYYVHSPEHSSEAVLFAVLRIHDILAWIRMRIRGSLPLTYGSESGCGSCNFRHWPSRCQQKTFFIVFLLIIF